MILIPSVAKQPSLHHQRSNLTSSPLLHTRRRILAPRGYCTVISVISRRWDRKGEEGGDLAQQIYLINLMRDAGLDIGVKEPPLGPPAAAEDFIAIA